MNRDVSPSICARALIEEVFVTYKGLILGFIDEVYWNTLKFTYIRTVEDVLNCYQKRWTETSKSPDQFCVLEIGAFAGIVSTALRRYGFRVVAQDISLFMKNEALLAHYRSEGIETVAADLADVPLPVFDRNFDLVICCEVLEHLNFNILPVFRDFWRVLKISGMLYLATPNQANIVKRIYLFSGKSVHDPVDRFSWQLDSTSTFSIGLHWREYTALELRQLLRMSGFHEIHHRYCHYNDRRESPRWRRLFVSAMYKAWPSFLPGQIVIGEKQTADKRL